MEQIARPVHLVTEQPGKLGREPAGVQVCVAVAETPPVFRGQVDPADVVVAGHVLPEIRELEPRADVVGQGRILAVVSLTQVEDKMPDRVG